MCKVAGLREVPLEVGGVRVRGDLYGALVLVLWQKPMDGGMGTRMNLN